jgi:hypothetical protein
VFVAFIVVDVFARPIGWPASTLRTTEHVLTCPPSPPRHAVRVLRAFKGGTAG